jgi:hypothetical protein
MTAKAKLPEELAADAEVDVVDGADDAAGPAAAQEIEANAGHYVTAALAGKPIRVVPATAWRMSWQRLAQAGNFDAFAEKVLHPDDVDLYYDVDPTLAEFNEFMTDAAEMAGESLGKSSGPRRSSRTTRRQ